MWSHDVTCKSSYSSKKTRPAKQIIFLISIADEGASTLFLHPPPSPPAPHKVRRLAGGGKAQLLSN